MDPLTGDQIRRSIRNCSTSERARLTLPDLAAIDWAERDVLGWLDPKIDQRGYLVQVTGDGPVGVMLRAPQSRVRRAAQCALCHSVRTDGVALFAARRGGAAGRRDDSVGTYICADLACSTHLREALKPTRERPDPAPLIAEQAAALQQRVGDFLAGVLNPGSAG